MLNSFLTQHTPDLAHPLFASIVGLLELLLFRIEPFELVIFCHHDLGSPIELALEVLDFSLNGFHIRNGCFAPLSPQPCPHGSSLLHFPPVIL